MTVCQNSPYKPVALGRTHTRAGRLRLTSTHTWSLQLLVCSPVQTQACQLSTLTSHRDLSLWQHRPPTSEALLLSKGAWSSPQPPCQRPLVSPSPSFQLVALRISTKAISRELGNTKSGSHFWSLILRSWFTQLLSLLVLVKLSMIKMLRSPPSPCQS